jgi:hypothetical protein
LTEEVHPEATTDQAPPAQQEAPPAPKPASAQQVLQGAMDKMNHPSNLALGDRVAAIQSALNVMALQLMPLLPTE